jgi:multidrug transporter EmrE-like cation transporter
MSRSLALVTGSVLLAVLGNVTLKVGMTEVGRIGSAELRALVPTAGRVLGNPKVLLGLALYFMSALLYMVALSRIPLSVAYPLTGLQYALIVTISWLALREGIPPLRWVGVLVICLGVALVGRSF